MRGYFLPEDGQKAFQRTRLRSRKVFLQSDPFGFAFFYPDCMFP